MTPVPGAGLRRIIRAPNHLGDVLMALPSMADDGADIMVLRRLCPLVEMAGLSANVVPLDRGVSGWRRAVASLRAGGYEHGSLLTPAFSAACSFRAHLPCDAAWSPPDQPVSAYTGTGGRPTTDAATSASAGGCGREVAAATRGGRAPGGDVPRIQRAGAEVATRPLCRGGSTAG
jgi:hypothetical protein